MKTNCILGMMSGTSLDGLDLALCRFTENESLHFELIEAQTIPYNTQWKEKLSRAMELSGDQLMQLNAELGIWMGKEAALFLGDNPHRCALIGSHGHTVFHRPDLSYSTQIGSGAHIAAESGLPVVCDFRSGDVAYGGQGAPLVPVGDELLFSQYDMCLNLGGIANISAKSGNKRIAFDICPANMALNQIARREGKEYDPSGEMASQGKPDLLLLEQLNALEFYSSHPPKSLGREWFEQHFFPLVSSSPLSSKDLLATLCEHIATQISNEANRLGGQSMLITGGGAHNAFLVNSISKKCRAQLILPPAKIIDFKEAILFAFLAWLRMHERPNSLSSVTGALKNCSGGAVYLP